MVWPGFPRPRRAGRSGHIDTVVPGPLPWTRPPHQPNRVGELVLDGEGARFRLWVTGREQERLRQVLDLPLTRS